MNSKEDPKRVSAVLRNIDFNAYRAYKNITVENGNHSERNPYNILKGGNNLMKYPFALKEKRFRWQTSNNVAETTELKGTLFKRNDVSSTNGKWDNLINKTEENVIVNTPTNRTSSTTQRKIQENSNGIRTLNPDLDTSTVESVKFSKRIDNNQKKSQATGSISNLINSTPDINFPVKSLKRYNIKHSSTDNREIHRKMNVPVDLMKNKSNDLGNKSLKKLEKSSSNLSVAKKRKIEHLTSNIFIPIKTQILQKKGKFVDPSKFITTNESTKKLGRNNSYIGKKQYDLSNFSTKENIFPSTNFTTILSHR